MIKQSLFALLSLSSLLAPLASQVQAELVLLNGKIWTLDKDMPEAEAMGIWQGRILAIGSDVRISKLIGPKTRQINLEGKRVLPGFIDNHVHFLSGSFWLSGVQLKDAANEEEFGERLRAKHAELPEGAWITQGTWDHDNWPGGELPSAELIDRYVPDRPVFVTRYDGHMSVANSLALRMAGIDAATEDPPGGIIVRKPGSREPAGVLKDTAESLVARIIPERSPEEIKTALRAGLAEARRLGVTGFHHVSLNADSLRAYQELLDAGELSARVNGHWPLPRWRELADLGINGNFDNRGFIKLGSLKGMMDGSLGSSTAVFFEPYTQDPSTSGVYVTNPEDMRRYVLAADAAGLHIAVHAIGDKANSEVLDIFAAAIEQNGPRDRRFRIEHAQHVHPDDFKRFAELGVIASVQPYHAVDDARFAEKRIGEERCASTYAFRSFLDHGARMSFGSDWTVAPLDPILGIAAAVTRQSTDGEFPDGWHPEQKISVQEAIEAYTLQSAYSVFDENRLGSLKAGKLADLVVLSADILAVPAEEIAEIEVLITVVDGRVVFEKE